MGARRARKQLDEDVMKRLRFLTEQPDSAIAHMIGRTDLSIEHEKDGVLTINVETEWALRGLLARLEYERNIEPVVFILDEAEQTYLVSNLPALPPHPERARIFLRLLETLKTRMMGEAEKLYQPRQAEGRGLGSHTFAATLSTPGGPVEGAPVVPMRPAGDTPEDPNVA